MLVVETTRRYLEKGHQVDLYLLNPKKTELYQQILNLEGVNILEPRSERSIYNPLQIRELAGAMKKRDYDIIHVHLFPSFYWAALAKFAMGRSKLVYTEHNTNNRRMDNAFYRWVDNRIYPRYDCHIAISKTVRQRLDAHINTNRNRVETIFNGIDLARIRRAQALEKTVLGLPDSARVLLQVSAFRPQKNQETLIRAMASLPNDVHLLLAGEGERKASCQELANSLGLKDRIHFLGVRKDVPNLLKTADIVVLSTHYEGLSLSSVEALASGKPFVASNVPGLSEVVEGAGLLFEDNDELALSAHLTALLDDPALRKEIGDRCLERSNRYDIQTMVEKYLKLYMHLLSNGSEQSIDPSPISYVK